MMIPHITRNMWNRVSVEKFITSPALVLLVVLRVPVFPVRHPTLGQVSQSTLENCLPLLREIRSVLRVLLAAGSVLRWLPNRRVHPIYLVAALLHHALPIPDGLPDALGHGLLGLVFKAPEVSVADVRAVESGYIHSDVR